MAKYKQRFNDNAKAGSVAKREALKEKRRHRKDKTPVEEQHAEQEAESSSNILQLPGKDLKRKLTHELSSNSKVDTKKKKRLEKYIDLKVRHQERDEIFEKLRASAVDTSGMQSLKRLGQTQELAKALKSEDEESDESEEEEAVPTELKKSTFIDHRKLGFGFQNLKKIEKQDTKKKMSWRERLGVPEGEEESESGKDDGEENTSESEDDSENEFQGFDDSNSESQDSETDDSDSEENPSEGKSFSDWAKSLTAAESIATPKVEGYVHTPRPVEKEEIEDYSNGPVERENQFSVEIRRPDDIKNSRLKLPATAFEQPVMEAIHHNDVVVITGETGSGKTTQIPQFLYEAGYGHRDSKTPGMIGVTQPRRVAALSMASRIGKELGDHGSKVGYQIRFDAKVDESTAIKFMTDGLLLREMASDLQLLKYSAVVVDEAHERSVNTDILIGMLSRVVKLRREEGNPLKLIIMSATLRVSDFTQNTTLFPSPPPVVSIEARQYPVSIHFNRRTPSDYVQEAVSKATKIHKRLPKGGILIFLTGQSEIIHAVRALRKLNGIKEEKALPTVRITAQDADIEDENVELDYGEEELNVEELENSEASDDQEEEGFEEEYDGEQTKIKVLPLYSLLPTAEQLKVFEEVPPNTRLCVVATNVAETSLTIPGIRYVVDCGRAKQREFDEKSGILKFRVSWISKAAADQRAGRAGRTGPGHCYRLFSSAVYERDFPQFSKPEIMRMPIEGLVLQMKAMGIHRIVNFPFPTPPSRESLAEGLKLLEYLGAVKDTGEKPLTDLGFKMSLFPLNPRLSKMLLIGNQIDCLPYIVAIVSALSVGEPFMQQYEVVGHIEDDADVGAKERANKLRSRYNAAMARFSALDARGDVLRTLAAVAGYTYTDNQQEYCGENFLREKIMTEIGKLRHQIAHLVAINTRPDAVETVTSALDTKLAIPSAKQISAIKQIVAAGYVDKVAVRADFTSDLKISKKTSIVQMPYSTLFPTAEKYVYIHPSSVLAHSGSKPPEFLIYYTLTQGDDENSKVRMRSLVDISAQALSNIAGSTPLITYSRPMSGAYAPKALSSIKREAWVVPRMGAAIGSGGVGWDLPPKKVVQQKIKGDWKIV